jgi:hypothetical protein
MQLETNVLELRQAHAERQKSWEETLTLREMELAQARVREEEVVLKLICRVPIKKCSSRTLNMPRNHARFKSTVPVFYDAELVKSRVHSLSCTAVEVLGECPVYLCSANNHYTTIRAKSGAKTTTTSEGGE